MSLFDRQIQTDLKVPKVAGYVVAVMPTLAHVKALQFLLKDKVSQEEPIPYDEFMANPKAYPDKTRIIWIKLENSLDVWRVMEPRAMFFAEEVFALVSKAIICNRDQSGMRWGNPDTQQSTADVLSSYWDAYAFVTR